MCHEPDKKSCVTSYSREIEDQSAIGSNINAVCFEKGTGTRNAIFTRRMIMETFEKE